MPPITLDSLLEQALTLSVRDRELLANRLYVSLEPAEGTPEEIAAAWHQEIHDRLDQYDRGEVKGIPADVVFTELTARLASHMSQSRKVAWHQEIHDRLDRYERGETKAFTWDECQAGMNEAIERARSARAARDAMQ